MITYVDGDLFTSPAQTLVNTVNTVGVMGKGIAKTFKNVYPEMFLEYQRLCETKRLTVGSLYLYRTPHKWILNFPTKRHWRRPSQKEDIRAGLKTFVASFASRGITSIAFPQLGCGNGGLDWEREVRPLMESFLSPLVIDIYIHVYSNGSLLPEHLNQEQMTEWLRSEPRSLPFSEVWNDLIKAVAENNLNDWGVIYREEPTLRLSHLGIAAELAYSDLFGLWQRFRRFGFMTPVDISPDLRVPPFALLELLSMLPYVARASVATLEEPLNREATPTEALLGEASSQGLRLVQPLMATAPTAPLFQLAEDSACCLSNLTLTQSAFA